MMGVGVEGWKEVKWGDLATLEYGKGLKGYKNSTDKVPVFGTNGHIGFTSKPLYEKPGIIIGRKGAYRGVHFSDKPFFVIDTAYYLNPKVRDLDIKWAYYELLTKDINNMDSGSAIPSTSRNDFYALPVNFPPLQEQKQIASILSTLDEKIELNHRINQNLEAMAQALFQSWFVDFEPFQDGEFVESELGLIPKGWKVRKLGDIINITSGKRPTNKAEQQNKKFNVALIGASSITGYVDQALYKEPILVTGRVGTHGVIQRVRGESWPSDNTLVIKTPYYEFVYQILKTLDYKSMNRGSTQPLITQRDIKNTQIVFPSDLVLSDFENQTKALYNLVNEFNDEIKTLSQLRDTLLPKLMSGEIRVPLDEKEAAHERADGNEAG
ncbi:type I restriction enzyme, S subunit [Melghirimyces thermohalophilus]|uniref:Type I restriction enzyme, S subunit n=1 Tax=Melghirimyces thermohalophilus TaxID=1236220 RepID=A0A1G6RL59_9BACL|nr:restriction endonuclease subunit S [Melghirimyces thermohalophilus]SDD05389.1 type I restriction enzyme, S subunit [Melghirimyces thermohalophilus]